jgi:hypothetical protein
VNTVGGEVMGAESWARASGSDHCLKAVGLWFGPGD